MFPHLASKHKSFYAVSVVFFSASSRLSCSIMLSRNGNKQGRYCSGRLGYCNHSQLSSTHPTIPCLPMPADLHRSTPLRYEEPKEKKEEKERTKHTSI